MNQTNATLSPYFLDLLDVDFRAEILAASLADQQVPPERIVINPTGLYSRAYSKDIQDVSDWLLEGSEFIYNRIDTPREGLFDMLPHYLFFSPKDPAGFENTDKILNGLRYDREQERQARLFFLPFDTEFNYLRTLSVHYDNSVEHLSGAATLINQFAEYWPIINDMTLIQAGIFLQILPWLHQLRSNLDWFSRFLQLFIDAPVRITVGQYHQQYTCTEGLPTLSNSRLGIDAILGDRFEDSGDIHLVIGPVPDVRIANFLPHTKIRTLLQNLIGYFLPVSTEVMISIDTFPPAPDTPRPTISYLGFNTFL
ncbi:hypothetical protein HNV11_20720 [Spirosoma taeanense]|uniref:Type VI secretion system baseplate subunit TssG n=1 Tax=Spirosoma taeanense TaxID=2735870 RepID=A0A6M5YE96_9BACT|nr:type VI secretion system baseplate subunit TssG [Spirosoma taeanense]QJW91631.1 hypothetical protein HNV11_20720 [Spirosoma taeanense]